MTTTTPIVENLRTAVETRDAEGQLAAYADDAVLRIVDAEHGPSAPQIVQGRDALRAHLSDICSRDMTHRVHRAVDGGDRISFEVHCAYPDGTRVTCMCVADLDADGRITDQTTVQAWDS